MQVDALLLMRHTAASFSHRAPLPRTLSPMGWWTLDAIPLIGSIIGIVTGVVTFVTLGVQLYRASPPSPMGEAVYYLLFINAILLITLSLLAIDLHRHAIFSHQTLNSIKQLTTEIDQSRSNFLSIAEQLHHLSIAYIDLVRYLQNKEATPIIDDVRETANSLLISMLNYFTAICDIYTGHKCSTCIKILTDHQEREDLESPTSRLPQHVWTHVRDAQADPQRRIADESLRPYPYHYLGNTAFVTIMNAEYYDDFWYDNNLEELSNYRNVNPHWRRYYNATAVAAIKGARAKRGHGVIGFLCVDNKGGGFDDKGIRLVMMSICNLLFKLYGQLWCVGEAAAEEGDSA